MTRLALRQFLIGCVLWFVPTLACAQSEELESLPPLASREAPSDFESLWKGYDPTLEPLEVEVLESWETDGVVLRVVRFRIGILKGEKATLAAIYGFPKGETKLPGLLQIHGGGQYADEKACIANAKRGYATLSIAWAGRISSSKYRVDPKGVQLFWKGDKTAPDFRETTDWGAVDGYHAPARNAGNQFPSIRPASWTLDGIESPRNSGWFLCAMAARRALTFLEQQPEVDAQRLGVYGHSMGGKLTVMTAMDPRVKAAAPSCGGISDRYNDSQLFRATLGDDVSLSQITCPIVFLSPANDFHGRIFDLPESLKEIRSSQWRVICSPHHNHQDTASYEVATMLWFDQHLKQDFRIPQTPTATLELETLESIPQLRIDVDPSRRIDRIDVYYSEQGAEQEGPSDRDQTMNRYWKHATVRKDGETWVADLPLLSTDVTLWAYANVTYGLDAAIEGVGYYYGAYKSEQLTLSSVMKVASRDDLADADVKPTLSPSLQIETFDGDWEQQWFSYRPERWGRSTHKLFDAQYRAPDAARLRLNIRSVVAQPMVIRLDDFVAVVELSGSGDWQEVVLALDDFQNYSGETLPDWKQVKRLTLSESERLAPPRGNPGKAKVVGRVWKGEPPEFKDLRWVPITVE